MTREELEAAAMVIRKYSAAVEKTLYWGMTTSEAKREISEAERLAELLESAARNCN